MSRPLLVTIIIFAAILGLILLFAVGRKPPAPQAAELELWGIDDEKLWSDVIRAFEKKYPHLTLRYRRLPERDYEETLLNRLAEGKGPDVFFLKNSWVTKHRDKIFPLPQRELQYSLKNFQESFVDIASDDLITREGKILGLPVYTDTLVLYYNKDILNGAGIASPPKTWEEAADISRKITQVGGAQSIMRSGIALGTTQNITHAFEIISSLILQQGDRIVAPHKSEIALGDPAASALEFYVSFANPAKTNFSWNSRLPNSFDAFSEGKVALLVGFGEDQKRIEAKNPHLNFGLAPLPQFKDTGRMLTYGRYYFPTVSKLSKFPRAAWQFILFAASQDGASIHLEKSGRPPSRRDLIAQAGKSVVENLFSRQALIAKSWTIPDEDASRRIFEEAVEAIGNRTATPSQAVQKLKEQLRLLLP